MSQEPRTHATTAVTSLAATARSILACPARISLSVDGSHEVVADAGELDFRDVDGSPLLRCLPESGLAEAARSGRSATLRAQSGLGAAGCADRAKTLILTGLLVSRGRQDCTCCEQERDLVALEPDLVLVAHDDSSDRQQRTSVPLPEFQSPELALNRGLFQRTVEHANTCHQLELRHAVATGSGTRASDVIGVQLAGLSAGGVELQWVDSTGAHRAAITFGQRATCAEELRDLLRGELHVDMC